MKPVIRDGWLMVPYSGPELTLIEIGIGGKWYPAFLDYDRGRRVAMIRPPGPVSPSLEVRVRAAGQEFS